ncbi:helix-turn-helix domain-containing protein [Massilia sp. DWR3-1-1]|jgi:transcriptional regulator with XRE-family HTH domain|uniref:helix-turn-helix domain-containing protein n=1 Tax=Massilia sp. DWR3-1-1 TaxID=2804559 RepID=UPI003CF20905
MTEITQLVATLKRQLKLQGKTYAQVAVALGLSEASVKRLFSGGQFTIERIVILCNLLGLTLAELAQAAEAGGARLRTLSAVQEKELVSDTRLLLVAVCALNHWSMADMLATYRMSEAQCLQGLLRLDRLGVITLLPGNRIRLTVARDFDWLPDGPIRHFFDTEGMADFLDSRFAASGDTLAFSHAMLTDAALDKLHGELRKLRAVFAELHEASLASPLPKRRGSALLLALREWEPARFTALRR